MLGVQSWREQSRDVSATTRRSVATSSTFDNPARLDVVEFAVNLDIERVSKRRSLISMNKSAYGVSWVDRRATYNTKAYLNPEATFQCNGVSLLSIDL